MAKMWFNVHLSLGKPGGQVWQGQNNPAKAMTPLAGWPAQVTPLALSCHSALLSNQGKKAPSCHFGQTQNAGG